MGLTKNQKRMRVLKKRVEKIKNAAIQSYYCHYYYSKIKENLILFDSCNRKALDGNLLFLIKEIYQRDDLHYSVILLTDDKAVESSKEKLRQQSIQIEVLSRNKRFRYRKALAQAKYIFTDTTLPYFYTKRDDQIVVNTWHGTPIKNMGKYNLRERYDLGNVQRNFVFADYIICHSNALKDRLFDSYMLEHIFKGKILYEGSPKNEVFFHDSTSSELRKTLNPNNKKIYLYMPTFRKQKSSADKAAWSQRLNDMFQEIDLMLDDNEELWVKLHPFDSANLDISAYTHIKLFPQLPNDDYEIVQISDALITDYSSIMYDYLCMEKKVVLFLPDKEEYCDDRGLAEDVEQMPFEIAYEIEELIAHLRSPYHAYPDEFTKYHVTYDSAGAASRIISHILKNDKVCREETLPGNGKENILIYAGGLLKNGITSALISLINSIDKEKRNYTFLFNRWNFLKEPLLFEQLPEDVNFMVLSNASQYTVTELFAYYMFRKEKTTKNTNKLLKRLYTREIQKHFGRQNLFSRVMNFEGYQDYNLRLLEHYQGPRTVWVHNDMVKLIASRNNLFYPTVREAYRNYDNVAVVSEDIIPPTIQVSGRDDNIHVVHNCHDHERVLERSQSEPEMNKTTEVTFHNLDGVNGVLKSDSYKIINIGRYSKEKEHLKLIAAFECFHREFPDSYLIIIGGHGPLYKKTMEYVKKKTAWQHIILIKSLPNPMPILKECDLFVLSSSFEGMPITLKEAASLKIPIVSTDIPGPHTFMNNYRGYLVEETAEALYEGMKAAYEGQIAPLDIDFSKYNQEAVQQFEELLR